MHRYLIVSSTLFAFLSLAWLTRLAYAVPIQIGVVNVPVWPSIFPVVIAGSLAFWGFRLAASAPRA